MYKSNGDVYFVQFGQDFTPEAFVKLVSFAFARLPMTRNLTKSNLVLTRTKIYFPLNFNHTSTVYIR